MLVVDPATLRDGPWRKFLDHYQLGVECVSFDELADDRRLNPLATTYKLRNDPDDYAMVVVDGAHNLRNPLARSAQRRCADCSEAAHPRM